MFTVLAIIIMAIDACIIVVLMLAVFYQILDEALVSLLSYKRPPYLILCELRKLVGIIVPDIVITKRAEDHVWTEESHKVAKE
jgi:hypothetical protein